ncbi:MAG: cation diffusion facilitator family transporter [Elusimicrobiaceae bacterium]
MNYDNLLKQEKVITKILISDCITVIPSIVIAVRSNSLVLMLDILDYALAMSSYAIAIVVLRKSRKSHSGIYDYGMGKFESLTSSVIAAIMLVGLLLLLGTAVHRFFSPVAVNPFFAVVGIAVKIIFFFMNGYFAFSCYKVGKLSPSPIMEAQFKANMTYAIGNIITIISLALGLLYSNHSWARLVDPAFVFVLAVFSGTAFIRLIKNSMSDLLDKTLEEELQFKILKHVVTAEEGYQRFYHIRSRKSGPKIFIEIALGFDPCTTVREALAVTGKIKNAVESDIPNSAVNVIISNNAAE